MTDPVADRDIVIKQLREELVGPAPTGEVISGPIKFETRRNHIHRGVRQMVKKFFSEHLHYTIWVGVLYPFGTP
jgi:hypothetical protein